MTISSIITNVSMTIDRTVVKESGTYLVETTGSGTTITDQETNEVFRVEPLDSTSFGVFTLLGDEPRTLTLGALQKSKASKDCGCRKPGMI